MQLLSVLLDISDRSEEGIAWFSSNGKDIGQALLVVLIGVLVVFALLAILVLFVTLLKLVSNRKRAAAGVAPAPIAPLTVVPDDDQAELAAVMAAVAVLYDEQGEDAPPFVVRSIRRQ
jgi:Na+-transporting methylmalonyl-CoA/oxaloacetate decarboxylase gamma subunit